MKYRDGRGGRHLQGRYHAREIEKLSRVNDEVFALNSPQTIGGRPTTAYLDLSVGGADPRRVTLELATAALPVTCDNFAKLCESGSVLDPENMKKKDGDWGYESTVVNKIEKGVGLCMGDVLGWGGDSGRCHSSLWSPVTNHPYASPYTFRDEPKVLSHVGPGIVAMLSPGVDENDSRFLITTGDTPQLDGRLVAFGRVSGGMNVIEDIVAEVFTKRGRPTIEVKIASCGVL